MLHPMTKAEQLLPLLRRAVALQAQLWDVCNEMEGVLGHEIETTDFQDWTAMTDDAEDAESLGLKAAQEFIDQYKK